MDKNKGKGKELNLDDLDDYEQELPPDFLLSKEEEEKLIQERIAQKKWREEHYINNPKYRNSPIPEDLLPDYKRRTPTPTMEMIKKDLDEKRKEDHWEEVKDTKKNVKKGGRKKKTMRKSKRKKMRKVRKSRKRNTRRRRK